jgi:hypothetical protein
MSTETQPTTEQQPVRPLGFYWVRVGHEWQVARYHFAGWFLTGISNPAPEGFIDQIGEPVLDNGTANVLVHYIKRARRYSTAALIVACISFIYSLLRYIFV